MHRFLDCASATFVACGSEHVAPVVLNRQQNAILRRGRCKRGSSHRQERTCRKISIVPSRAELAVSQAWAKFLARRFARCSCRRSIVTAANKIKTAAAARPKPNDHQLCVVSLKRHQLEVAFPEAVDLLSLRASPIRSKSIGDGCAGRSFLSSFSSSEKSFIAVAKFSSDWSRHTGTAMPLCSAKFPARRRSAECKIVPDFQDQ